MNPAIFPYNDRGANYNSKHKCCVKSCKSRSLDGRLSFHYFPKPNQSFIKRKNDKGNAEKIDRLEAWKIALGMDEVGPTARICSLHFRKDDYFFPDVEAKKRYLKRNAVPTLFVPNDTFKSLYVNNNQGQVQCDNQHNIGNNEKTVIKEELEFVAVKSEPIDEMSSDEGTNFSSIENTHSLATYQKESSLSKSKDMRTVKNLQPKRCSVKILKHAAIQVNERNIENLKHAAIQVDVLYSSSKILDFIQSDSDLNTLTGIPTFKALDAVVTSVKDETRNQFEKDLCEMKTKDRVIMTCAKIKHNLSYSFLTIMFRSSTKKMAISSCRYTCTDMLWILYNCLKKAPADELTAITLKRLNLEKYQNFSEDK